VKRRWREGGDVKKGRKWLRDRNPADNPGYRIFSRWPRRAQEPLRRASPLLGRPVPSAGAENEVRGRMTKRMTEGGEGAPHSRGERRRGGNRASTSRNFPKTRLTSFEKTPPSSFSFPPLDRPVYMPSMKGENRRGFHLRPGGGGKQCTRQCSTRIRGRAQFHPRIFAAASLSKSARARARARFEPIGLRRNRWSLSNKCCGLAALQSSKNSPYLPSSFFPCLCFSFLFFFFFFESIVEERMLVGSIHFQSRYNHCQISARSTRFRSAKMGATERASERARALCISRRRGWNGKIEGAEKRVHRVTNCTSTGRVAVSTGC